MSGNAIILGNPIAPAMGKKESIIQEERSSRVCVGRSRLSFGNPIAPAMGKRKSIS